MATISAAMVKDLREKTGAGMMECKKALVAVDGDMDAAVDELRKAGLAKAAKKADRATNEGKIVSITTDKVAVMVEVLCETDFVGRNEVFGKFCDDLADRVAAMTAVGDVSAEVQAAEQGRIGDLVTNVGENVQIRRALRWVPEGAVSAYIHGGRIGVLVEVAGTVKDDDFGRKLAMHIAAASPTFLVPSDIPADVIEKEKEIARALPELASKPAKILENIIEGKIRKWYTDACLTKQTWVHDNESAVEKVEPGATILRFARWQIGEEV